MRDFSAMSVDIHFQALCNAVENEKVDKIRSILDHNPHLDVTERNSDKLTPLDIAFMLANQEILGILVRHKTMLLGGMAAAGAGHLVSSGASGSTGRTSFQHISTFDLTPITFLNFVTCSS